MIISIDGRFVNRKVGGQERYAWETLTELDKICNKGEFEIVIPSNSVVNPSFKNISIVKYGKKKNMVLWEQLDFKRYLKKRHSLGLYLLNTWPLFRPDFPVMHDAVMFSKKQLFGKSIYNKLSCTYHKLLFKSASKRMILAFTVSHFSKAELMKYLKIDENKIVVGQCGWQHFKNIQIDKTVFDDFPMIKSKSFFLSVSSRTPQKNFKWVIEEAKKEPNEMFVIVGEKVSLGDSANSELPNLIFTGRLSDERVKALMSECKAFIHPAIYEGFGIPPLEAASVGAKLIISPEASLSEIYTEYAHYIDPFSHNLSLNDLLKEKINDNVDELLTKWSWENNARIIYNAIKPYFDEDII